jgi:chloride channel, nucleotide-sensitive, 1A
MKYKSSIEALYVNISLNDASAVNDDEDITILELTVLPPGYDTDSPQTSCIQEIFGAMNTCADLHPDPDDDDGDTFDETAPGATGWITADNMEDFMDENGNFRGTVIGGEGEELGPGAGTVRQRENEEGDTNGVNGTGGTAHEDKYQRTG